MKSHTRPQYRRDEFEHIPSRNRLKIGVISALRADPPQRVPLLRLVHGIAAQNIAAGPTIMIHLPGAEIWRYYGNAIVVEQG